MNKYKSQEELPLVLNASNISMALGISRSKSYEILNNINFPSIRIGKKLIVTKYSFLEWLKSQENKPN